MQLPEFTYFLVNKRRAMGIYQKMKRVIIGLKWLGITRAASRISAQ